MISLECVFHRNLIQAMGLICLLAGNEAAVVNYVGGPKVSAPRSDDLLKIIRRLPSTNLTLLARRELISWLLDPLEVWLRRTRPLFAQEILGELYQGSMMRYQPTNQWYWVSLVVPRIRLLRNEITYWSRSIYGLYSQRSFIFCLGFNNNQPCSKCCCMKANRIRLDDGNLKAPEKVSHDTIIFT
jgi:hypothetical protein